MTFAFGMLLYLLVRRALRPAERRYVEAHGDSFDSLVLPRIGAVVGGAFLSGAMKFVLWQALFA
jgi:hypothetical protein